MCLNCALGLAQVPSHNTCKGPEHFYKENSRLAVVVELDADLKLLPRREHKVLDFLWKAFYEE